MAVPSSQQDLTSILGHPSNLSAGSSLSSLLMKNHPPLSLLGETLPYLKSSQSFTEDLNILGVPPMEDHQSEYDAKMKLPSVFDDDCDTTGLMPFGQSDMKMLDAENQCNIKVSGRFGLEPLESSVLLLFASPRSLAFVFIRLRANVYVPVVTPEISQPFSDRFGLPPPRMFPGLNEVKILGPKNHSHDLMTPHYQDRVLSPFEQFFKSTVMQTTGSCVPGAIDPPEGCRKEVKILGKKLGTGIITTTEQGDIVKVVDDKVKFVSELPSPEQISEEKWLVYSAIRRKLCIYSEKKKKLTFRSYRCRIYD